MPAYLRLLLCYPNRLRSVTWLLWMATVVAYFILLRVDWSPQLERLIQLGFDHSFTEPLLGLASSQDLETAQSIFATEADQEAAKRFIRGDMIFVPVYITLLLLLSLRAKPKSLIRRLNLFLVLLIGLTDFAENYSTTKFLETLVPDAALTSEGANLSMLHTLGLLSTAKWVLLFSHASLFALTSLSLKLSPPIPAFFRTLVCLLFLSAGGLGFFALLRHHGALHESCILIYGIAIGLLPLWLFNPDSPWKE